MKIKLILLFVLFIEIGFAQKNAQLSNIQNRKLISLNGMWSYVINPTVKVLLEDVDQKNKSRLIEYQYTDMATMNVPGSWNSFADYLLFYENPIWYKKAFNYKLPVGKRAYIYLGAVNSESTVGVNGQKLGYHSGGYTPFNFEVTKQLKKDGNNYVVVEADNRRRIDAIPGQDINWWNYGGITRDAYIVELPETFIHNYLIQLDKGSKNNIKGWLRLNGKKGIQQVTIQIPDLGITQSLKTNEDGYVRFEISARNLTLWTPETPKRYKVIIKAETDQIEDMIGFRSIEVQADKIMLNGKPLFLRGISIHDEAPKKKSGITSLDDAKMMIERAKELNCNYIKLSHFPHSEQIINMADELGMLVCSEIPVYSDIAWEEDDTYRFAKQQLREIVERDRNRACVIMWSIANSTTVSDERNTALRDLINYSRNLDATRLVTATLTTKPDEDDPKIQILEDPIAENLDVIGLKQNIGWYKTEGFDGLPTDCPATSWSISTTKPIIASEFGAGALAGFHADSLTRWTEEFQASFYYAQLKMINKWPHIAGLAPGFLYDYRSPKCNNPVYQKFYNRKGLISENGERKKAFKIIKDHYTEMEIKTR